MKNPFFNLPDFGGELLDFRLALRLVVRQAFKPMLGQAGHPTPRHAGRTVIKPAFVPALKMALRNNLRFVYRTFFRFQQLFPVISTFAGRSIKPVAGKHAVKTAAGKSLGGKPVAGKSPSGKSAMGKSGYKTPVHEGKRIVAVDNSDAAASRVIHPTGAQPEKARDGMWVEYNKHAVVVARGTYTNNQKNGLWREYYDTGELMIEEHYLLDAQHGRFATFHPNGQCCSDGSYEHGRREGQFFMFDESGRHVRTLTFKRDTLVDDVIVEESLAMA
ncbi:MAG TPA: hypothetical protein VK658_02105 [Chryseolinea sp.]|nr:hypothetical protein [Chryseolinea sp.]